jgi:hypothetical protein
MMNSAMRLLKRPWKRLLRGKIDKERHRAKINPVFPYSQSARRWETTVDIGIGGWCKVSNLSGDCHGLLRQWRDYYGLGAKVLLVSEKMEPPTHTDRFDPPQTSNCRKVNHLPSDRWRG